VASSPIATRLVELAAIADSLGHLRMYIDGGQSFNKLNASSGELFDELRLLAGSDWTQLIGGTK
jgi:hypothetical protein